MFQSYLLIFFSALLPVFMGQMSYAETKNDKRHFVNDQLENFLNTTGPDYRWEAIKQMRRERARMAGIEYKEKDLDLMSSQYTNAVAFAESIRVRNLNNRFKLLVRPPAFTKENAQKEFKSSQSQVINQPFPEAGPLRRPRVNGRGADDKFERIFEALTTDDSFKNVGNNAQLRRGQNGPQRESLGGSWTWHSYYLLFDEYDYVDNLDEWWGSVWAPYGTQGIQLYFDKIDLERGRDYVHVYDSYGLCASFTGYHVYDRMEEVCFGDEVDIWIETDYSVNGANGYDGFEVDDYYAANGFTTPNAVATASNYYPLANTSVHFTSRSTDPNYYSWELEYYWDFGDNSWNSTSTSQNPFHTYSREGTYWVELEVCNIWGCDIDGFYIEVQRGYVSSNFSFAANPVGDDIPARVYVSSNNQADEVTVDWGDGSTPFYNGNHHNSPITNIPHRYASAGNYLVTVTASNSFSTSISSETLEVRAGGVAPTIYITGESLQSLAQAAGQGYEVPSFETIMHDDSFISQYTLNWGGPFTNNVESYTNAQMRDNYWTHYGYPSAFKVDRSYQYRDPNHDPRSNRRNKRGWRAGMYSIVAAATDDRGLQTSTAPYVFRTKNETPVVKKKWKINKRNQPTITYTLREDKLDKTMWDKDGEIVSYRWEFYAYDKQTRTYTQLTDPGCPTQDNQLVATCTFPQSTERAGDFRVRLVVVDNFGAEAFVEKKQKIKKLRQRR